MFIGCPYILPLETLRFSLTIVKALQVSSPGRHADHTIHYDNCTHLAYKVKYYHLDFCQPRLKDNSYESASQPCKCSSHKQIPHHFGK